MPFESGLAIEIAPMRPAGRSETERRVLHEVQRGGALAGAEIARRAGISAQTASVVARQLETDGLLRREAPLRGRVGKPSVPLSLNPDGALAFGLKIGRRSADLVLLDLCGAVRGRLSRRHDFPIPDDIFAFLEAGVEELTAPIDAAARARICGVGVGAPFQLWSWLDVLGVPSDRMLGWRDISIADEVARRVRMPALLGNDATLACAAELVFGRGRQISDFAYFLVAGFIGGGVAIGGKVWPGPTGNAGAFGSMPVRDVRAPRHQLLENASVYRLERALARAGLSPDACREDGFDWQAASGPVADWIDETAHHIAIAAVSACAVLDTADVVLDTVLPRPALARLTAATAERIKLIETQGLREITVSAGAVGREASAIGAAYLPIAARHLPVGADFF